MIVHHEIPKYMSKYIFLFLKMNKYYPFFKKKELTLSNFDLENVLSFSFLLNYLY